MFTHGEPKCDNGSVKIQGMLHTQMCFLQLPSTIQAYEASLTHLMMMMMMAVLLSCRYIWLYWANPFQYSQRALLINEFTDARWNGENSPGPYNTGLGHYLLQTKGLPSHYW